MCYKNTINVFIIDNVLNVKKFKFHMIIQKLGEHMKLPLPNEQIIKQKPVYLFIMGFLIGIVINYLLYELFF